MKILTAFYYEFLKNVRDIKMIAILIIFPAISIFILGTAIGGFFNSDVDAKIPVGYVNRDTGSTGAAFDKFLHVKEIGDRLDITVFSDRDPGQKALDDGKVDVLIFLPENLSQNILKGSKQRILLYGTKNAAFVESLLSGFTSSFNVVNALVSAGGKPVQPDGESNMERVFLSKNAVTIRAIDYYSVLTLLQLLILGGILGVYITARTYGSDIHIRIHTLPVRGWSILLGRILGSTVYLFLAAIIIILFTKFVYHSNWNGNLLIILGTILVFCVITIGLGVLAGLLVKSPSIALMLIVMLMCLFGIASGAISPTGTLDFLSFAIPNHHAKILLFGTIYGYSKQVMVEAALWLSGFLAVVYGAVALLSRRVRYDNI